MSCDNGGSTVVVSGGGGGGWDSWGLGSWGWGSGPGGGGGGGGNKKQTSAPNKSQQTQQQCLNSYYNSTAGKVVDFGSFLGIVPGWSPNAWSNLTEISTLGAAKYGGLTGAAKLANTYDVQQIATLNSVVNIGSSVGAGLDALIHGITKAAGVLSAGATITDLSAHYACWAAGNPDLAASWAQNQQY